MTTDGFIRKKVESLTLGEKLRKLREQYRMSYADIAKATRIQVKYLERLERGEYDQLPAEVYVRGFLRSYARYLGLDDDAFLKLYDKEKHIREHLGYEERETSPLQAPALQAFIITPRILVTLLLVLVLGGVALYVFFEFRSFVAEPSLIVTAPLSGKKIESATVAVMGKTDPGANVVVNNDPIFIDAVGNFSETVALQPGLNRIIVRSTNRFEKTKEAIVIVESQLVPQNEEETATFQENNQVSLGGYDFLVRAVVQSVDVTVTSGDRVLYAGTLLPGKEEHFSQLTNDVRISTTSALHTEVSFNGESPKTIGSSDVPVNGKVYPTPKEK